jgi:CheY-like chemotaxis protein
MARILMVDDSEIACTLMRVELLPFGYEVIQAETIEEAEGRLRVDASVQAVMLDFSVAELLGGPAVVERLRKSRGGGRLPVLLHSALRDDELRARATHMGADGAYRKGGRLLSLVEQLRDLCPNEDAVHAG